MAVSSQAFASGASAHAYISAKWGVPVQALPLQTYSVPNTPLQIAKNNPRRMLCLILNEGVASIDIGFDASVVTGAGIPVPPLGGSVLLVVDEDADLVTYNVFAVAPVVTTTVKVLEIQAV